MRILLVAILVAVTSVACASTQQTACGQVDRSLTSERRVVLAPKIAEQLNASKIDVLAQFTSGTWSIVYIDTHKADPAFLFYPSDPLTSHYVTVWSGAATSDEEQEITGWALKNAPGIPQQLASCFAWYVTKGRKM